MMQHVSESLAGRIRILNLGTLSASELSRTELLKNKRDLLWKGGFGGQIANTTMYDAALNPEMVYRNYIAGPDQITGFSQWFTSFFDTGVDVTVSAK